MRAGRLKTKRYKTGRGMGPWAMLLLGAALGLGAAALQGERPPVLSAPPAATKAPIEEKTETRTVTLNAKSWYALQLGVFDSREAALQTAKAYQARGAGGYVFEKDGCRALAAAYETRADAQAVMTRLKERHGVDTAVVEVALPAVTLRLSGRGSQLTALSDAWDAMEKLTGHLCALSLSLDRGEIPLSDVRAALFSERDTLNALREGLLSRFGQQPPEAVAALERVLSECAQSLEEALNASTAVGLGAQVKYCHLQCLCEMAAYAASLY